MIHGNKIQNLKDKEDRAKTRAIDRQNKLRIQRIGDKLDLLKAKKKKKVRK